MDKMCRKLTHLPCVANQSDAQWGACAFVPNTIAHTSTSRFAALMRTSLGHKPPFISENGTPFIEENSTKPDLKTEKPYTP